MTNQPNDPDDLSFDERVAQSIWDVFWAPEIERRCGPEAIGQLSKALAVLPPGGPVEVKFNDECRLVAKVRSSRAIEQGEEVTAADVQDVEDLKPVDIDPDAGWVSMLVLPDGSTTLSFDFRRNLARGRELLALADQYLESALTSLSVGHWALVWMRRPPRLNLPYRP